LKALPERLKASPYPGRGIILGTAPDGLSGFALYFLTGRSVNSRNRVIKREGNLLRTEAFDPALLSDPTLVIYNAARIESDRIVVTNGSQTDDIDNLHAWTFEPDSLSTPRISAVIVPDGAYELSILKSLGTAGVAEAAVTRQYFEYEPQPGTLRFISTYNGSAENPQAFAGEPLADGFDGNYDLAFDKIWEALDRENRISIAMLTYPISNISKGEQAEWNSNTVSTRIRNQRELEE
jgi:IMP cyclohydrolase